MGKTGVSQLALTAALLALPGCAGFKSTPVAPLAVDARPKTAADGIYYYMPMKPIIVQAVLDPNSNMTISTQTVSAIPDRSKPYLLTVPRNLIGENHATLQVDTNGLLQIAATEETSGITDLAQKIAADLATISGLARPRASATSPAPMCEASNTYSRVIWPEKTQNIEPLCGLTVTVQQLGGHSPIKDTQRAEDYKAQSGVFYRTEIPYLVTVNSATQAQAFIAYSPDLAPVQFLPLEKSFFAKNNTTFTLSDGILTKSESDIGGELVGFLALPTEIIAAYMQAVGAIFESLKTNSGDQNALAVSDAQRQICRAAIAANPVQGVDATQAAANYAAIQAACGN